MSLKYKYLFRFGRGRKAVDLLGSSISDFWNDIYDLFDIYNELSVQKLDRTDFTDSEIRKIARELFEDMDEDYYLIRTEITGKKLHFSSLGINAAIELDELQDLVQEYFEISEKPGIVNVLPRARELFYGLGERGGIGVLIVELLEENETVPKSLVQRFYEDCETKKVDERVIVTHTQMENDAKRYAEVVNMKIRTPDQLRNEMNESLMQVALDLRKAEIRVEKGRRFSLDRFKILLDYVKNARTNVAKKRSLEDLAEYLLNGIRGLEVVSRNPRGPSEEVDLIVANESKNEFFRRLGNPLLVECRHRRKPATSKDIRDFSGKMGSMAIKTGFLFSLKGITGDKYDAQSALRDAKKEGKDIVMLDMNDLLQISQGANPIAVIRNAFYRFV